MGPARGRQRQAGRGLSSFGLARGGALATVALMLLAVSACGKKSSEDTPLEVLRSFDSALVSGDGKKACALLTDRRREQVNADASAFNRDCPETLGHLADAGSPDAAGVKALESAHLGQVTITGDTATIEVDASAFGASIAQLERQDGKWRVSESAAGF
jgi:hypothetical protein